MLRTSFAFAFALLAFTVAAAVSHQSPPQTPLAPTEVKIVSVPPAQPTEVKIVSTPSPTPAEVKIVSAPKDESADALVQETFSIVVANFILCVITAVFGWSQRSDSRKSIKVSELAAHAAGVSADAADRSAGAAGRSVAASLRHERGLAERDLNRAAHQVMVTASRLTALASNVIRARTDLSILSGQGALPPSVRDELDKTLQERRARMQEISGVAQEVVASGIASLSDAVLTQKLWRLDEYLVQLDAIREAITEELTRYDGESLMRRQQRTAMEAAALGGQLARPLKTTLG